MALRMLVVSRDSALAARLRSETAHVGAVVTEARPHELEEELHGFRPPQVIILDGREAAETLGELCEAIRSQRRLRSIPLLALVSEHQLERLPTSASVDDFVVAPYREAELRARLQRLAARLDHATSATAIRAGQLVLDPATYDVTVGGVRVDLTLKEYELLKYLMTHPGRVFTRDQLLDSVWGYDYVGGARTVDVHVRRLRAKLGEAGETALETMRGVGYCFRSPRQESDS